MKTLLCAVLIATPVGVHAAPAKQQYAYDVYVQAAKTIVSATPPVDPVDDPKLETDPKVRAQKYSLARKEAWLRKNAKGFALFQKALTLPVKRTVDTRNPSFEHYGRLRQLARSKTIERNAREMRGDWFGSVHSRIDTVQMGNDVAVGGTLIASLVGVAIQAIGRDTPWPATEKLNALQARAAIARLEKIYARRVTAAESLQGEKAYGLAVLRNMMRDPKWRTSGGWFEEFPPADRVQLLTVAPETVERNYLRIMDAQIANARLPYTAPKAPIPVADDPVNRSFGSVFNNAGFNFARNDSATAVWMCALALRAFRLENGKYPATLNELAPRYLKEIPADPFGGGEKLRYKRTAKSYLLWSIGPDGKDDGGTPIRHRYGLKLAAGQKRNLPFVSTDSTGDYVAGKNR
ncbi:MAG TPA: hypothetical protein VF681_08665 [Abditibacteriaceae bacterium]|jgi:hypothetical protein